MSKTPFQICFALLTDVDVRTDKNQQHMDDLGNFREHFEDFYNLKDSEHVSWWDRLQSRTDISDDDRWEIQTLDDDFYLLINIRDNLKKSGVFL